MVNENNIKNAELFLSTREKRKLPYNEQLGDESYIDVAIDGAKYLNEKEHQEETHGTN